MPDIYVVNDPISYALVIYFLGIAITYAISQVFFGKRK